jgi:hypothetical protein
MASCVELAKRLEELPKLKSRVEDILSIAENADGTLTKADDVEDRVTEEIQKLAREVMQGWAEKENQKQADKFIKADKRSHKNGKKNCTGTRNTEK